MDKPARYLFVYFKVHAQDASELWPALQTMAARLRMLVPGLGVRLMRRPQPHDGLQTWMEAYEHADGIGADVLSRIEAAASQLPDLLVGGRRVEAFEPLDAAPPERP